VTAEPGRLGTPALFAIADASGGILVKLPSGVPQPARGRAVVATGPLADPYGQLEIRPAADGLLVEGPATLPEPTDVPTSGPDESTEARLVRLTGTVLARPIKATSGDISLLVETPSTTVRVMADASSGLTVASFVKGARYRIVGIAGQRATKKGALDGYRVWARDRQDVTLLTPAPTPSPSSGSTGSSGRPAPSVAAIATALRTTDRAVAIEAVVTAGASLLDNSGRRIVVQDATGAIEILLPKQTTAPGVGARIRAIGRVGKAYGAPRLRADSIERKGSAATPAPLRIQGPVTAAHAWRLVEVAGRVEGVHKLGDRWRAEIAVGTAMLVVLGQPGSRIPNTALTAGRIAEIVGIVRPAYPTASDKRPSILPRSAADVQQTGGAAPGPTAATSTATKPTASGSSAAPIGVVRDIVDADLVDLATLLGSTVRVGGLVLDLTDDGFTLDDGTATGRVVLTGSAAGLVDLVEPGDAINATGRVGEVNDAGPVVIVDDPAALVLGSSLGALEDGATPSPASSDAAASQADARIAAFTDPTGGLPGTGAGVAGLLTIGVASVAMTLLRRRHGRRLLAARVAARLALISRASGATHGEDPGRKGSASVG
jgi:hypothetical protein